MGMYSLGMVREKRTLAPDLLSESGMMFGLFDVSHACLKINRPQE